MTSGSGVTWFHRPVGDDPATGTLNPVYDLLDRRVIAGDADAVLLMGEEARPQTVARVLEQVAGLAGALGALGVEPGSVVTVRMDNDEAAVLAHLAALRLGARVAEASSPVVVVTDRPETADQEAGVVIVHGEGPSGDDGLDWSVALRAGLTDPAGVADVAGTPAMVRLAEQLAAPCEWTAALLREVLNGSARP